MKAEDEELKVTFRHYSLLFNFDILEIIESKRRADKVGDMYFEAVWCDDRLSNETVDISPNWLEATMAYIERLEEYVAALEVAYQEDVIEKLSDESDNNA